MARETGGAGRECDHDSVRDNGLALTIVLGLIPPDRAPEDLKSRSLLRPLAARLYLLFRA
jgi:hypothetical protein